VVDPWDMIHGRNGVVRTFTNVGTGQGALRDAPATKVFDKIVASQDLPGAGSSWSAPRHSHRLVGQPCRRARSSALWIAAGGGACSGASPVAAGPAVATLVGPHLGELAWRRRPDHWPNARAPRITRERSVLAR
jgi:hypothetical protein